MWYVIIAEDIENSLPLRKEHRPAHLARLQALQAEAPLLTAGPNPAIDADDPGEAGFSGSVMIVDFPSLIEAKAWRMLIRCCSRRLWQSNGKTI